MNEKLLPSFSIMKDGDPLKSLYQLMRDSGYSEDEARKSVEGYCKDMHLTPEETEELLKDWKKVTIPLSRLSGWEKCKV